MKKTVKLSLPLLLMMGCASLSAEETVEENAELEAIQTFCSSKLAENRRLYNQLKAIEGEKTISSFLVPYNQLEVKMTDSYAHAQLYGATHPNADVRNYANNCVKDFTSLSNEISLSQAVYNALLAVDISEADEETKRYHAILVNRFKLSGVDKDAETRASIKNILKEIAATGLQFNKNIREDVKVLLLDSVEQLQGLPQDYIDSHQPGDDGKIRVTTQYTDYKPFMRYAESDDLRKQLFLKYNQRGYPANVAVLTQLVQKRHELAQLLGYESFAEYIISDKMAGNPARVTKLFDDVAKLAKPGKEKDYRKMLAFLQKMDSDAEKVNAWQDSYLADKIKTTEFNLDSKQVREYFSYPKVRDGLFKIVQDLFQVRIQRREEVATWHESVEAYEMYDGETLIGRFFLDMHPRDGKYKHAAQFPYKTGIAGQQVPEAVLVCNFSKDGKALMLHSQVRTFFHEFGHLIHTLFSGEHQWSGISGIKTEMDFAEAPSQMLEEWIWNKEVLQTFATNEHGEVIPDTLVAKMNQARSFKLGMDTMQQLYYGALSLNLYNQNPADYNIAQLNQTLANKYSPYGYIDGTHLYTWFGHLNGYSAMYYTYQWSKAIAADMLTKFKAEGLTNTQVAAEYREKVLSQGGAKPAARLVQDFLGREYNFEAYANQLNASQD
ncbi:Zn-dependent oligopeptidase [Endozoicomonas sp. SM1973]|uniref:Zn-dependent oligopeptidase n=1 Tax=Spartinivicinus marinus TaxID=2994442 RepID=A0A853HWX7_9GAMM|nr:M3 family metallopeptidase [Spartinivicinus marinus]MCX4029868.1 Zn-dependent oligopeptidase [Spartinivicinus marinus]NYZ64889.1 Zn-dependent oligopeptidase [Spartinivicinus marinus]